MSITKLGRGRPSRASIYAATDQEMADLAHIGGLPGPEVSHEIWAGIWYEETHNSTAIEGNTLLLQEVRQLLEEGQAVGSKQLSEYLQVQGYARAADWVYSQASDRETERDERITLTELREIHRRAVEAEWQAQPPEGLAPGEGPGNFRRHDINPFPGGMVPPPWTDVPPQVSDWLALANTAPAAGTHVIEHLARVHAEFERIHPFRDGNGRTGRLVLNLLLVRAGYAPVVIYKRDRTRYLRALRRADQGEYGPLGELVARAVKDCLDRFLLPSLAGRLQLRPISSLASKDTSPLALRRAAERGRLRAYRKEAGWYSTEAWVEEYLETRKPGAEARQDPDVDHLTGAPNRRAFSRLGRISGLAMIDLVGFKKVNDAHGHVAGDVALRTVGQRLRNGFGADSVFRYGGDEFAIAFRDRMTEQEGEAVCQRIVDLISQPIRNLDLSIGATVGLSLSPTRRKPDTLLISADRANWTARHFGLTYMIEPTTGPAATITTAD